MRKFIAGFNFSTLSADGAAAPSSSEVILVAARQVLVRRGASLQSPQKAGEYLTACLGHLDHEIFGLILRHLCLLSAYVDWPPNSLRI
jgi:hypothetical protein